MKNRLLFTAAVAATAVAGTTPAFAIDYDYVEARYTAAGDVVDVGDTTGFGLEVSRSFGDWFFARASADLYGIDVGSDTDQALDLFSIGPGVRLPLTAGRNPIDLWGMLNYQRIAAGGVETGIGADVGLSMEITNDLQGRVAVSGMDDDDIDLDLYEVRVAYDIDQDVAVTGSLLNGDVDIGGDDRELENLVRVGVRYRF